MTDGQGRFIWLVSQLHHQAFTYLMSQAIAQTSNQPAVLDEPVFAHVWSGPQTFVLAYDNTDVVLNLPFDKGQLIDITVYDVHSNPVREDLGVPYGGPLRASLNKYSLMVVEPTRG